MGDFFDPTGAVVPESDLAKHLSDGTAFAHPDQDYKVRDKAGTVQTVKGGQIGNALGAGWTILPSAEAAFEGRRKELESTGSNIQTAIERGVSGATFGLSDIAARELAPEYEDRAAERARVNPSAGAIGGAIGIVAGSKGLGGIGKGAAGLTAKVLGGIEATTPAARMALRAAAGAGSGALEGALYGAGTTAGELALGNDEITAEKVLSGAGQGGLFGALLGGGLGFAGQGIEEIGTAMRGNTDRLMAQKVDALQASLREQGASEAEIARKTADEVAKLERRGGALQQFANKKATGTLEIDPKMLRERAAAAGTTVDDLIQQAGSDYLGYEMQTGPLAGKRIFHGAGRPIDVIDDVQHALGETRQTVQHFEEMADKSLVSRPEMQAQAAPLRDEIVSLLGGRKAMPTPFAREVAGDLAGVLKSPETVPLGELRGAREALDARIEATTGKSQLKALTGIGRALDDAMKTTTRGALEAAGVDASQYLAAQRTHQSLSLVRDAIEEMKLDTKSGGHSGGLTGYALAASLLGHFPHSVMAGASLVAHKLLEGRAGGIVADVAHRVASSDVRLGWGAKALAGDAWSAGIKSVSKAPPAAPFMARVAELSSDPAKLNAFVADHTESVAKTYPNLAAPMTMKLLADIQHLASHLPAPIGRSGASMTPAAVRSYPTAKAATDWMERAAALNDPGTVVDSVLNGRVPSAAIDTLKTQRPELWEKMRQDVATEVAARSDELPFKRRITLGIAFEFASDRSLSPGAVAGIQASLSAPVPTPGALGAPPSAGPGRLPMPHTPDISSMQTITQGTIGQ